MLTYIRIFNSKSNIINIKKKKLRIKFLKHNLRNVLGTFVQTTKML